MLSASELFTVKQTIVPGVVTLGTVTLGTVTLGTVTEMCDPSAQEAEAECYQVLAQSSWGAYSTFNLAQLRSKTSSKTKHNKTKQTT